MNESFSPDRDGEPSRLEYRFADLKTVGIKGLNRTQYRQVRYSGPFGPVLVLEDRKARVIGIISRLEAESLETRVPHRYALLSTVQPNCGFTEYEYRFAD
jgi:hypothetical protein